MSQHTYTAAMKWALVCISVVFLAGCGAPDQAEEMSTSAASAPAGASQDEAVAGPAPPPQGDVTDEKIGLPAYPGATEVESSRVKLHSDIGDTFSVSYRTPDSPTQVAAFYQTEAAKLGKMKESRSTSEQLKSVAVDRTDGSQSAIQAMTDGKGVTIISVHRFFPKQ